MSWDAKRKKAFRYRKHITQNPGRTYRVLAGLLKFSAHFFLSVALVVPSRR